MIGLTLALALGADPAGWAVLAGHPPGYDPSGAQVAAEQLAEALRRDGAQARSGLLLGDVREVGADVPGDAQRLLDSAIGHYRSGELGNALRDAAQADAILAAAPRSVAVEAAERSDQLVWGFTLVQLDRGVDATAVPVAERGGAQLTWALARSPRLDADPELYTPPLLAVFERVRAVVDATASATLRVDGDAGASVYVDGVLQGEAPLTLTGLSPHAAWVWLERAGRHGLAHRIVLGAQPASLTVDLALESRLALGAEGALVFEAGPGDPDLPALLRRLAARLGVAAVASVSRGDTGGWSITAVDGDRLIVEQTADAGGPAVVARLRNDSTERPLPSPWKEPTAMATGTAAVVAAPAHRAPLWPWLVTGAAVVAAGVATGLYFALNHSPDVGLSFSRGSP